MLPEFTASGLLPVGDHDMTLRELRSSFLVTGNGVAAASWDTAWRTELVDNLIKFVPQLWQVGIGPIFINGSFVENKPSPNDVDGYFVADGQAIASGVLENRLRAIEPSGIWTWDPGRRWPPVASTTAHYRMWHEYRLELLPYTPGFSTPIVGPTGQRLTLPELFRLRRHTWEPKGIVRLVRPRRR